MDNVDLNCAGPLVLRFFPVVNPTELHGLRLATAAAMEPQMQRADDELCADFQLHVGLATLAPHAVQREMFSLVLFHYFVSTASCPNSVRR